MPKGAHLKKEQDSKRVKSILLRFTQHEFAQLQNYCKGLGIERSEMVREAVFKAIDFHKQEKESQAAPQPVKEVERPMPKVEATVQPEKSDSTLEEFLEQLVDIYQTRARQIGFDRKVDCNVYRATLYEFNNLMHDYTKRALREEFERYCQHLFTADFINSHLFRGFELHISGNFEFWNKHNRGSSNYVGY